MFFRSIGSVRHKVGDFTMLCDDVAFSAMCEEPCVNPCPQPT